jgi:hypothetical protein
MKVAQVEYHNWGDVDDPTSDWSILNKKATFSHKDACEFILWTGHNWRSEGCSKALADIVKDAAIANYSYICIYA